ncbi:MAG TPA: kynureninase [Actinophytocola sp.]|uniref:kynureninase/PvdN C-terminal domain-containing protein n=1 Tax=Actinophytocola sp. TaxID=1872138 RepID=UPI002DB6C934|nr:kynureninase [Actinophytocola sp.]HEU5470388.1 kynureninase [Actinophytocola sp.]
MPNPLARHYTRFRVADRLLLTGHSHQAWPDVAEQGQLEAFADAAEAVDAKWARAFAKADAVRDGFRLLLDEPGADLALDTNTHALVTRFLSALDLRRRPRLVTTDGEFHTVRRQLARLAEAGIEVERVPAEPVGTLAERLAAAIDVRTSAVLVSAVLFETSRIVPGLGGLAAECAQAEVELLVDAYHALGVVPFSVPGQGLAGAWVTGGGYKYLQLGEGNCFLRLPGHAAALRPVLTGWFAEFEDLSGESTPDRIGYAPGGDRFAGATYDPTSHYRAARVFRFFTEQGLSAAALRELSQRQTTLLANEFDALGAPDEVVTRDRDTPRSEFGGFLALRSSRAAALCAALAQRGVSTDSRGDFLRFGPAPYLADEQLAAAIGALGAVLS